MFSDPDHNSVCDDLPLSLCHSHLPLLPKTLHHHPSSRKECQVIVLLMIVITAMITAMIVTMITAMIINMIITMIRAGS